MGTGARMQAIITLGKYCLKSKPWKKIMEKGYIINTSEYPLDYKEKVVESQFNKTWYFKFDKVGLKWQYKDILLSRKKKGELLHYQPQFS